MSEGLKIMADGCFSEWFFYGVSLWQGTLVTGFLEAYSIFNYLIFLKEIK